MPSIYVHKRTSVHPFWRISNKCQVCLTMAVDLTICYCSSVIKCIWSIVTNLVVQYRILSSYLFHYTVCALYVLCSILTTWNYLPQISHVCALYVMFHTNNMKLFTTDFPCSVSSPGHVPANCQGNGVLGWSESCTQRPCCKKLHVRLFHPGIICFMHGVSLVFSGHSQNLSHSCVVMKKIWESEAACCTSYSGLKTISRVQSKHSVLSLSQTRWSQTRWSQTRWSQASCSKCNV